MEASGQQTGPSWLPSGVDKDALLERLQGLKDRLPVEALKDRLPAAPATGASGGAGSGDAAGSTAPAPPFDERPELYVGAAFAGGLALAGVLRLLGR